MKQGRRRRRRRRQPPGERPEQTQQHHHPPLRIEYLPVDALVPWERNPRHMSPAEMEKLKRSISHHGWAEPIVARSQDRTVIGGHQRLAAAIALGLERVPVVLLNLSETEAKLLGLALNRIQGEFDLPLLGELLSSLRDLPDVDETLSGFNGPEIEDVLAELERGQMPPPYEESFDLAAELLQAQRLSAPTRVQAGEIWRLGRHQLFCGDSLESGRLLHLLGQRRVDLVCTDPPFGIGYQSTAARRGRRKQPIAGDEVEGFEELLDRALPAIKAVMKPGAVLHWFAGGGGAEPVLAKALLAIAEHFTLLNTIVWDKLDPGLGWRWRRSWEAIVEAANGRPSTWNGSTGKRNVLRFPKAIPQSEEHPTPKPVPLLRELITACSPTNGLVLDPFAGSGSTLIACELSGRSCLAAELEPRFCDIVLARWQSMTGEQPCRETEGA